MAKVCLTDKREYHFWALAQFLLLPQAAETAYIASKLRKQMIKCYTCKERLLAYKYMKKKHKFKGTLKN